MLNANVLWDLSVIVLWSAANYKVKTQDQKLRQVVNDVMRLRGMFNLGKYGKGEKLYSQYMTADKDTKAALEVTAAAMDFQTKQEEGTKAAQAQQRKVNEKNMLVMSTIAVALSVIFFTIGLPLQGMTTLLASISVFLYPDYKMNVLSFVCMLITKGVKIKVIMLADLICRFMKIDRSSKIYVPLSCGIALIVAFL